MFCKTREDMFMIFQTERVGPVLSLVCSLASDVWLSCSCFVLSLVSLSLVVPVLFFPCSLVPVLFYPWSLVVPALFFALCCLQPVCVCLCFCVFPVCAYLIIMVPPFPVTSLHLKHKRFTTILLIP